MKLLAVNRLPGTELTEFPHVDMLADSSVVTPGKPLFLPAIADNYDLVIAPAFRISRLGKNIAPRFAHRYYDAVSMAALVIARFPEPRSGALATAFDSSIVEGRWLPLPEPGQQLSVGINNTDTITISIEETGINDVIALLSRYFTLKNGDIIMPCRFGQSYKAVIDTRFNVNVDSNPTIELKIK